MYVHVCEYVAERESIQLTASTRAQPRYTQIQIQMHTDTPAHTFTPTPEITGAVMN